MQIYQTDSDKLGGFLESPLERANALIIVPILFLLEKSEVKNQKWYCMHILNV